MGIVVRTLAAATKMGRVHDDEVVDVVDECCGRVKRLSRSAGSTV